MSFIRLIVVCLWICFTLMPSASAQNKLSLALFNLSPVSIEAIGIDGDLLFSMRNQLEKSDVFQIMSRRDMEVALSRFGGAQIADTALVVKYGRSLGVNYILTGTIDLSRTTIVVNFRLVDVVEGVNAAEWEELFDTKSELVSRASEIAAKLERKVRSAEMVAAKSEVAADPDVISAFTANLAGDQVVLQWTTGASTTAFYYNIYRGNALEGPFEFLKSASEPRFNDSNIETSGVFYYRIGVVLETGEEVQGNIIASANVSKTDTSTDVSPPTLLSHKALVNGIEIQFVPSISNKDPISGYQLYYRQANQSWSKGSFMRERNLLNYTLRFSDPQLLAQQYEFAVSSVTKNKESPRSNSVYLDISPLPELMVDPEVRTREVVLKVVNPAQHQMRFYRKGQDDNDWKMLATQPAGVTEFIDNQGLADGQEYQYALTIADAYSESAKSNIVNAQTKLLPAPLEFAAQSGVKSAVLTWQPVDDPDVKGYRIFRKQGSVAQGDLLDEIAQINNPNTAEFIDGTGQQPPLLDGTQYNYLVTAVNKFDGQGDVTVTESIVTKPRPIGASGPVLNVEDGAIALQWAESATADVDNYIIERKWEQGSWREIAAVPATELFFLDQDLRPYSMTYYRIVAQDKDGLRSDPTEAVSIESPEVVVLSVSETPGVRRVALSWSSHSNITGYKLYRRQADSNNWRLIAQPTAQQRSYTDNNTEALRDGVLYDYAIAVNSEDGESVKSSSVAAMTKAPPSPPDGISAESGLVKSVRISWAAATDTDVGGYNLYRESAANRFELIETIKAGGLSSYVDKGTFFKKLEDGKQYVYMVRAFNRFNVEGGDSTPIVAVTKPIPNRVEGLAVEVANYNAQLSWMANPENDIRHYEVYRGSTCSSLRSVAKTSNTRYIDASAADGKTYCYRVAAVDADELEGQRSVGIQVAIPEKTNI